MKKIALSFLLFVSVDAFSQEIDSDTSIFFPDTAINKTLKLLDAKSILNNIGNQSGKLINDEKASRIQLKNSGNSEYLILYHLNGSNANSFNQFEVGMLDEKTDSFKASNFISFYTQENLTLGINSEALIKIKGRNFSKYYKDGFAIFKYPIQHKNDNFLKRYNMPIYVAEYYFRNDKLYKFIIGFPNL